MKKKSILFLTLMAAMLVFSLTMSACSNKNSTLTNLEITSQPTKTEYIEGESFDASGMIVKALYSDASRQIITDYTIDKTQPLTMDDAQVTISYNEKSVVQKITVKKYTRLEITSPPTKTEYIEGESFDASGMVVKALYSNGSSQIITDYTIDKTQSLTMDDAQVTISYNEKSVVQKITVKKYTRLEITSPPTKTEYIEGESFDASGMVVKALYSNGSSQIITDYMIDKTQSLTMSDTQVTISYNGKSVVQEIALHKKAVKLTVESIPRTEYLSGKLYDFSELSISAEFTDGSIETLDDYLMNLQSGEEAVVGDKLLISYQSISVEIALDISYLTFDNLDLSYIKQETELKVSKYRGSDREFILPKNFSGFNITKIDSEAFGNCDNLEVLKIQDNITDIASGAFSGGSFIICLEYEKKPTDWDENWMNGLAIIWAYKTIIIDDYFDYAIHQEEVYITNYKGLASVLVIPDYINSRPVVSLGDTFSGNESLTNIVLPIHLKEISDYAFSSSNIKSINIPSSVTSIGEEAFYYCSGLTSITIPSSVTSIGEEAFYYCSGLTSITIPSSVTSIGSHAFYNCSGLTSITIPSSVTSIGDYAFSWCDGLTKVNITDIAAWCNISFEGYSANPLSYAKNLYLNDELVKDLVIPEGVTAIGDYAFYNYSNLTSITIGNSVTSIGYEMFRGCSKLTSIIVDKGNTKYHSAGNCIIETATKTLIVGWNNSVIPTDGSVTRIGDYAFYDCRGLTSITIPSSVTSIGSCAFFWCSGLTSVAFGDNSQLTSIGDDAFSDCSGLTSITIPNSVTSIGSHAFYNCSGLTSITIPSSVTSIGSWAFSWCSELTITLETNAVPSSWNVNWNSSNRPVIVGDKEVVLPIDVEIEIDGVKYAIKDGVASLINYQRIGAKYVVPTTITYQDVEYSVTSIGKFAFYGCSGLTSITIPSSVTSIGSWAFDGCSGLKEVHITDIAAWCNISFGDMQANPLSCAHNLYLNDALVTDLVIPEGVTSIGEDAFMGCSGLTSITIPSSVTSIGSNAFKYCSGLTSVAFGDNSQLTSIGRSAFSDCSGLTSIATPDSVTSIGEEAFYYCSGLTRVAFSDNSQLANIGASAFEYCSGLIGIDIPNSVISVGNGVFRNCRSLRKVLLPMAASNLSGDLFANCGNLTEIYIRDGSTIYLSIESNLYTASGKTLIRYLPNNLMSEFIVPNGVVRIDSKAFSGCSNLRKIIIPNGVTSIGEDAFRGCSGLTSVAFGDNSQLISIGDFAFDGCSELTSVAFGDNSQLTSIGFNAFNYCSGLTSITIPEGVTSIGRFAFRGCSGLTSVAFGDNSQLISIGRDAFSECSGLTSIIIPDNVTSIGDYGFDGCSGLTSVAFGDNSQLTSIGSWAFSWCSGLTSITIPSSVTSIGSWAFSGCSELTITLETNAVPSSWNVNWNSSNRPVIVGDKEVVLPIDVEIEIDGVKYAIKDGVASLIKYQRIGANYVVPTTITYQDVEYSVTSIGSNAFSGCSGLTSITIPSNVTSIGSWAFAGCSGLTSITIPSSVTSIGSSVFEGCNSLTSITVDDGNTKYHSASNCIIETNNKILIVGCKNSVIPTDGSVTSIGSNAFNGCSGLTSITIPSSVTSIGEYAFEGCNKLQIFFNGAKEDITLGYNWTGGSPAYFSSKMFESTAEFYFELFDGKITLIKYLGNEENVVIPDKVILGGIEYDVWALGKGLFENKNKLKSITINANIMNIDKDFVVGCISLNQIVIADNNDYYSFDNGILYNKEKTILYKLCFETGEPIVLPQSLKTIFSYAFENASIVSITIPKSVETIGSFAFSNCTNLTSAQVDVANQYYASIDGVLFDKEIKVLILYPINKSDANFYKVPDTVERLESYSSINKFLKAIYVHGNVSVIRDYAFADYIGVITSHEQRPENWSNYMFENHGNVLWEVQGEVVVIEGVIYSLDFNRATVLRFVGDAIHVILQQRIVYQWDSYQLSQIAQYAFKDCTSLTSISIPNSVTSIGSYAFYGCSGLTSITIPSNVTSIGDRAFEGCNSLTNIIVDEGNTKYHSAGNCIIETNSKILILGCENSVIPTDGSVTSIGSNAFNGCSGLTSITIPSSVTNIGDYAFYGCSGLVSITYNGTKLQWTEISKGNEWNWNTGTYTVYCTDGNISK